MSNSAEDLLVQIENTNTQIMSANQYLPSQQQQQGTVLIPVGYVNGQPAYIQQPIRMQPPQQPPVRTAPVNNIYANNGTFINRGASPPPAYNNIETVSHAPHPPVVANNSIAVADDDRELRNSLKSLVDKQLTKSYPRGFTIVYSLISLSVSILNLVYGVAISDLTPVPIIFGGVTSFYMICASTITLISACHPRYNVVLASFILQLIGIFMSLMGYVAVNVYVISMSSFVYNYNDALTPSTIMCAVGGASTILSIVFVLVMHCHAIGKCGSNCCCCRPSNQAPIPENFPKAYLTAHGIFMILLGISHIVLQSCVMQAEDYLSSMGSGIWIGVFNTIAGIIALRLIKRQKLALLNFSKFLHITSLLLSILGFIVLDSILFALYGSYSCSYDECYPDYSITLPLVIPMFSFGLTVMFLDIVFLVKMSRNSQYFLRARAAAPVIGHGNPVYMPGHIQNNNTKYSTRRYNPPAQF